MRQVSAGKASSSTLTWCYANWATLVVWGAMAVWAVALFARVKSDHERFRTLRFDLGNMVQAVWNTAHGRPLESTYENGDQLARLAAHVDPILVLLTPLWLVVPSPMTLAAAQIAAVAAGALPVFWLARRHLRVPAGSGVPGARLSDLPLARLDGS